MNTMSAGRIKVFRFFRWRGACACLVLAGNGLGWAGGGSDQRGPAVLRMDPTVRSRSLGGAFAGLADDAGALYWNPAGLQQTPRQEITLGRGLLYGDQTQDAGIYVRPVWRAGTRETWAVGISHLAVSPFDVKEEGNDRGQAHPSESVFSLGYARPWKRFSVGMVGKYIRQETYQETGSAYAIDAGIQTVTGRFTWGASLANAGTAMSVGASTTELPLALRFGSSVQLIKSQARSWVGTAQVDFPAEDRAIYRAGLEYGLSLGGEWRTALRAGYVSKGESRLAMGAGLDRGPLGINYVFEPAGDLGTSNRLELCWRFGSPSAPPGNKGAKAGLKKTEPAVSKRRDQEPKHAVANPNDRARAKSKPRSPSKQP